MQIQYILLFGRVEVLLKQEGREDVSQADNNLVIKRKKKQKKGNMLHCTELTGPLVINKITEHFSFFQKSQLASLLI